MADDWRAAHLEATREIAIKVQTVLQATQGATEAICGAKTAADASEATSRCVLSAAERVALTSGSLRDEVEHFLTAIRADANPAERRRYERVSGRGVLAEVQGGTQGKVSAPIRDISLGGAGLLCTWPSDIGGEILVGLPGASGLVSARIVDSENGLLVITFRQDPESLAQVANAIDALVAHELPVQVRPAA